MADRIKGITVEIGGDTTDLSASLRGINNESKEIGKELSDVQRLLKFNPDNVELLEQRQQLLNRQIENTSERLQHLRSVEQQVQRQFERGEIGEQQFRAFQREIIATEGRLQHFENQARGTSRNVKGAFKELGKGMAGAIGAAVAGAGLNEVIQKSLETAHTKTMIEVSVDVPPDQVGKVQELVTNIKAYGVDAEAALEGVRRQFALHKDATTEENNAIIKNAALISQSYAGIDFTELIQETNEMAGSLGMSQEQALGMVNALLKMGFPPDQLDIITEYGAQLQRAGYDASEIQAIFAAGIDTKSWNIDKLMDGIKEGRIRLAEFGNQVDKQTLSLIKGTDISKSKLQEWGVAVAQGGDSAKVAMGEVALQLSKIKDADQRNAIGVRLFGTMWEDTGAKITDTMLTYQQHTQDAKKNQDLLNDSAKKFDADPMYKMNKALGEMQTKLAPLMTSVADFIAKIADWINKNPQLAATIAAVVVGLGILIGAIAGVAAVIGVLDAAAVALDMALLPFIGLMAAWVLAIGLVIAAIVLVVKHWDDIKAKAAADWAELTAIFSSAGEKIKTKAQADWNDLVSKVSALGQRIKDKFNTDLAAFVKIWTDMGAKIKSKFNSDVEELKSIGRKITTFFKNIDLKQIGHDIMEGFLKGITGMAQKVWNKAQEIANGVSKWMKKALRTGSPSKVTMEIGEFTGQGFIVGLENTIDDLKGMSYKFNDSIVSSLNDLSGSTLNNLEQYFAAIADDGDWLNDMLMHIPQSLRGITLALGKYLAPTLQGTLKELQPIKDNVIDFTNSIIASLDKNFNDKDNVVTEYFEAIQEDGDYLNDMLTHMPKKVAAVAEQMGKMLAPSLEGTRIQDFNKDWDGNNRYINVTLNSPKALDVREANKEFSRTMNRMALMW
jgi:phage-related minor tail protein